MCVYIINYLHLPTVLTLYSSNSYISHKRPNLYNIHTIVKLQDTHIFKEQKMNKRSLLISMLYRHL